MESKISAQQMFVFTRKNAINLIFLLCFILLAIIHSRNIYTPDALTIVYISIGIMPILFPYFNKQLLPYLNSNFKSIELFGLKAEMLEQKVQNQEVVIKEQQQIIHDLVVYSMAFYLYEMLCDFDKCERGEMHEYIYSKTPTWERNLRYLRDNGYLELTFKIASLNDKENIAQKVKLTPIGKFYIRIRPNYKRNI